MEIKNSDKLVQAFTVDYIGKLYYFCLKKTGNVIEAEDLSSEIAISIIQQLRKGVVPVSFSAWVWKIARNKYSLWADIKHKQKMSVSGTSIDELDLVDYKNTPLENEIIHREDVKLLRRELAFISCDYRELLVSYYIESKKVRDMAIILNLSESAAKTKLFRARNILKEGMNMAREFGIRSYKPENVNFAASGNQPSGLPWKAVGRKIPKNILLEAHNNPSTIEELSIELGIAAPYMEEEVNYLVDATLMKKIGSKYITDFFIADKEVQLAVYNLQKKGSSERASIISKIIEDSKESIFALDIMKDGVSWESFKWLLLTYIIDFAIQMNTPDNIWNGFNRANGETWGFMGFETHNLIPESTDMRHNGCGCIVATLWEYTYAAHGVNSRFCINNEYFDNQRVAFLTDIIKNNRKTSTFTLSEQTYWEKINGFLAHADGNGNVIPDIIVFMPKVMNAFKDILKSNMDFNKLKEMVADLATDIGKILKDYSNPILHEQINYYVAMMMCSIRPMAVNSAVKSKYLTVPDKAEKKMLSVWLEMN